MNYVKDTWCRGGPNPNRSVMNPPPGPPRSLLTRAIILVAVFLLPPSSPSVISHHPSKSSSYLWRINSSPPCYMFGTIHVPYTRVWDSVPENAKNAFVAARQVCNHSFLSICRPFGQYSLPFDSYVCLICSSSLIMIFLITRPTLSST